MNPVARYALNIGVALSQFLNAALGGDPDEVFSSRAHKMAASNPWPERVIDALFFFHPGHCRRSAEWDEGGKAVRPRLH